MCFSRKAKPLLRSGKKSPVFRVSDAFKNEKTFSVLYPKKNGKTDAFVGFGNNRIRF